MSGDSIGRILKRDIVRVAQVGALTGSVAGFAGLIAADGSGAVAGATAARWTSLLVVTLPLGLVLSTASEVLRTAYSAANTFALVRVLLIIGLIGGAGGVVLEFVVANYIPTVFSFLRLDVVQVRAALIAGYPWISALSALGATVVMAILEGLIFRRLGTSVGGKQKSSSSEG